VRPRSCRLFLPLSRISWDGTLGLAAPGAGGGPALAEKPDAVLLIGLYGGLTESLLTSSGSSSTICTKTVRSSAQHAVPGYRAGRYENATLVSGPIN
jgi:hypothetical protein